MVRAIKWAGLRHSALTAPQPHRVNKNRNKRDNNDGGDCSVSGRHIYI